MNGVARKVIRPGAIAASESNGIKLRKIDLGKVDISLHGAVVRVPCIWRDQADASPRDGDLKTLLIKNFPGLVVLRSPKAFVDDHDHPPRRRLCARRHSTEENRTKNENSEHRTDLAH